MEDRIAKTHERIAPLDDSEQALRARWSERRGIIAEVLAALQRMGRQTPPGIMLRAEDALQSVRSAMMLGAVLPEMRHQAEALAADLAELVRLRKQIAEERDRLARDLLVLADDRQRLPLFIDERQKRQAEAEKALTEERQRAAQLARQAENLNQLIVKLEQGLDTASRAARAAGRSGDERKADGQAESRRAQGSRAAEPGDRLRLGQGNAAVAGQRGENQGIRRPGRASEAPKRAYRSPPGPAARSRLRVTAGWSMPAPSAITANS